jgi:hypothetical protein
MTSELLAQPDRRIISPPDAPITDSIVRLLIYTFGADLMQQRRRNVLAKAELIV